MRTLHIRMETVKVLAYSSREEGLSLELSWNDGSSRKTSYLAKVRDARLAAEEVIMKVSLAEKGFNPGMLLEFENESELKHRLGHFFTELLAKTLRVKNARLAEGYLSLVRDIMHTRVIFD